MQPWSGELAGRLDERLLDSAVLRGNPLGDPAQRPLWVQLPPSYDESSDAGAGAAGRRYPVVYVLQGYTGQVTMWRNRAAFRKPFPERADDVLADPAVPDCLVVYVDAWTAYGGSQFVDSPGTGRYHTYLCEEVVPYVDEHYRTVRAPAARAVAGKSSGGFGAMITPLLRPDLFGLLATHAGDALYECCYVPTFPAAARSLRAYDGDVQAFWSDFHAREPMTKDGDDELLLLLGCAACFSADDDGTPQLPFDPRTGRLREDVWARWLSWDPVRMLEQPAYAEAARGLRAVWIDAGTRDEWFLDLGAQAFRDGLRDLGVPDERVCFELFDATHGGLAHRYPMALRWLAERLAQDGAG